MSLHHVLLSHSHDVSHLLHDFALNILIRLFSVDLVEGALLTDVLSAFKLEELSRFSTIASVA